MGVADRLWNFVQDRDDVAEVLQSLTVCRPRHVDMATIINTRPTICDSLTDGLRDPSLSIDSFRRQLKTFCFQISFCVFSALEILCRCAYR